MPRPSGRHALVLGAALVALTSVPSPPAPAPPALPALPVERPIPAPSPSPTTLGNRSARPQDVVAAPRPVSLRVPSLGVDAPVVGVGVVPGTAQLAVPPDATTVAWYSPGPAPGAPGSAVLAAHVDYAGRPGVFLSLRDLRPGARIEVGYDDGATRSFSVVASHTWPKDTLPTDRLFTRDGPPQLTLVTCGGAFDPARRSYADNTVVVAEPDP